MGNHLLKSFAKILCAALIVVLLPLLVSCSKTDKSLEAPTEKVVRGPITFKIDIRTELKALKSHKIEAQPVFPPSGNGNLQT